MSYVHFCERYQRPRGTEILILWEGSKSVLDDAVVFVEIVDGSLSIRSIFSFQVRGVVSIFIYPSDHMMCRGRPLPLFLRWEGICG